MPRPTQSYSESDECCVIYQELPGLDNVKQTVTAEINITSSNGNTIFCDLGVRFISRPCPMQRPSWRHPMMCTGDVRRGRRQRGTQTRGQMLTPASAKSQLPSGPPALSRDFSQQSRVMFIFGKWSNLDLEQIGRYLRSHNLDSLFQRKHQMVPCHTINTHFVRRSGRSVSP